MWQNLRGSSYQFLRSRASSVWSCFPFLLLAWQRPFCFVRQAHICFNWLSVRSLPIKSMIRRRKKSETYTFFSSLLLLPKVIWITTEQAGSVVVKLLFQMLESFGTWSIICFLLKTFGFWKCLGISEFNRLIRLLQSDISVVTILIFIFQVSDSSTKC